MNCNKVPTNANAGTLCTLRLAKVGPESDKVAGRIRVGSDQYAPVQYAHAHARDPAGNC